MRMMLHVSVKTTDVRNEDLIVLLILENNKQKKKTKKKRHRLSNHTDITGDQSDSFWALLHNIKIFGTWFDKLFFDWCSCRSCEQS